MGIFLNEILIFPMFTWFHLVPCLSLHGLIVAHLRDWHSVICLFSPNFPLVRISEFILNLDQTAALLCSYYDYTPKISILKDLQLFKMPGSFMLYIDICKCWKLNHNYWNKFKVPMFYSTVSGLFLFFSPEHWCVHKSSLNIRSVTIDDKLVNEGSLICVPCGMK